ncbi:MAG: hypothetical protein JXQ27_06015 [Acidobacteria bacterium]|nr:hypothetical protein [Acidobacteriota bacterium]
MIVGSLTRFMLPGLVLLLSGAGSAWSVAADPATENILTLAPGESSPPASIEAVAWLAGAWQGAALGGRCDEVWSPPAGGAMMGMFRLVKDGRPVFYELLTISPEQGSLILRLKHFDAGLKGWEKQAETVDFPLVKLTATAAYFSRLTFRRDGADRLHVFVSSTRKDGSAQELRFDYIRVTE